MLGNGAEMIWGVGFGHDAVYSGGTKNSLYFKARQFIEVEFTLRY